MAPQGAHHVADLLMFNSTIRTLDLRGNALGNDGAIILSRGLKTAESIKLQELDMGYNEIRDEGACALAQVRGCMWTQRGRLRNIIRHNEVACVTCMRSLA